MPRGYGKNSTGWLHWHSARAGKTRSRNAPSVGEQVLVLCLGGELDTGFVLPGIFSDGNPPHPHLLMRCTGHSLTGQ